jgi:hypothetical protein
MPLITGIKRIYKNKATVKRPEKAERPTKGRARGAASAQIRASTEGVCNQ